MNSIAAIKQSAIVFEFDDILYPQKDYDLQVFYLFAHFLEYLEAFPPANDLISFLQKRYEVYGKAGLFEEAARVFGIDQKYKQNFDKLFRTAKLPLKLLLYKDIPELLQNLLKHNKKLFILTKGNPEIQLNKLKQTEWNGLENKLKIYFADELGENALQNLLEQNHLKRNDVLLLGKSEDDSIYASQQCIDYLYVHNLISR